MKIELGKGYREKITGFSGIAVAYCEYLTGCNQACIQPRGLREGKTMDPMWFDVQKLELDEGLGTIVIDNGATPGSDFAPPTVRG